MSRTVNSFRNIFTSISGEVIILLLKFITRTVFIHVLGTKYLGVSGLFTNIISTLSLAELGIGTAITYNLYKPINQNDQNRIIQLMNLYKNSYRVIGLIIGIFGLAVIPFLPILIRDEIGFIKNINLVFILYLMQSVSSYLFFAYRSTIIRANQKEFIITIITTISAIVTNIVQIIILYFIGSFTIYVLIVVIFNVIQNIVISIYASKMYPFINKKPKNKLNRNEKKEIIKNCYAISIYKAHNVVLNATDNIVLSSFIGLHIVGIYSNYLLIIGTVKLLLNKLYNAVSASIGDLHASEDVEKEYLVFKSINFFTVCAYGLVSVGTFILANDFIGIWIGKEYTLTNLFVFLLSFEIYLFGLQKVLATFRTSMGLFQQAKYRPIFSIVINLLISIVLVNHIGINGVLIGTITSSILTFMWFDPYIIFKHVFVHKRVRTYYYKNIVYAFFVFATGYITYLIVNMIPNNNLGYLLLKGVLCIIIFAFSVFIFYWRSEEVIYLKKITFNIIRKK